jgi:hypothetical protein
LEAVPTVQRLQAAGSQSTLAAPFDQSTPPQDAQEFALFVLNQLSKETPTDAKLPDNLKPHYPRAIPANNGSSSTGAKPKAKGRGKSASAEAELKQIRSHDFIHQQFGGALRSQVRA